MEVKAIKTSGNLSPRIKTLSLETPSRHKASVSSLASCSHNKSKAHLKNHPTSKKTPSTVLFYLMVLKLARHSIYVSYISIKYLNSGKYTDIRAAIISSNKILHMYNFWLN